MAGPGAFFWLATHRNHLMSTSRRSRVRSREALRSTAQDTSTNELPKPPWEHNKSGRRQGGAKTASRATYRNFRLSLFLSFSFPNHLQDDLGPKSLFQDDLARFQDDVGLFPRRCWLVSQTRLPVSKTTSAPVSLPPSFLHCSAPQLRLFSLNSGRCSTTLGQAECTKRWKNVP